MSDGSFDQSATWLPPYHAVGRGGVCALLLSLAGACGGVEEHCWQTPGLLGSCPATADVHYWGSRFSSPWFMTAFARRPAAWLRVCLRHGPCSVLGFNLLSTAC